MTTLKDIAKRTGVSQATVSRVLNGYPDVNESTRVKVQRAIVEMGYTTGSMGRTKETGRSMTIGVFYAANDYGELTHHFFQDVFDAFKKEVGHQGYDLLFFSMDHPQARDEPFDVRARMRSVDGLLLVSITRMDGRISSLSTSSIPCMSIDLDLAGPRAGYLCSDNIAGSMKAMEYLVSMGHSKIAFIGDKFATKPGHDRLIGYRQTLQSHGLTFRPEWVLNGDFLEAGGYEAAKQLLQAEEWPSAIFCASDLMAIGAMRAIAESGLRVGDDISLVGFDDIPAAAMVSPGLTTVRQHRRDIGTRAARSLIQLIEEPQMIPPIVTLPTELVIRESVKRPSPSVVPNVPEA